MNLKKESVWMVNNSDREYIKKFVNSGNEYSGNIKKSSVAGIFFLFPTIGVLISLLLGKNPLGFNIAFLAIIVVGIICTIASDKWFFGNRGHLFLAWLGVAGIGLSCFLFGLVIVYDRFNILIIIFIAVHVIVAALTLKRIMKYISCRKTPKERQQISWKKMGYYGIGSGLGVLLVYLIVSWATEGAGNDIEYIVPAVVFMSVSTVIWFHNQKLVQLYYAVKYDIDVVNTWFGRKNYYGQGGVNHCRLLGKTIEGSHCMKINYGNEKMLEPDTLNVVMEALNMTSDAIRQVCKGCDHYPFREL